MTVPTFDAPSVPEVVARRFRGDYPVDEWGLDGDLVRTLLPLARLRWSIETIGAPNLPVEGGGVLVHNRRFGISERLVLDTAVHHAIRRVVRFPGVPDIAPVGPLLRRLGGVLGRADEIRGLLRAGHLMTLPLGREPLARGSAGGADAELLQPALDVHVPVVPVAVVGLEVGWRWKVVVGRPLAYSGSRVPLAATGLADMARDAVQDLLDEHVGPLF
jgi:hypothetical protein